MIRRRDFFYYWLGVTIVGIVTVAFLALTRYQADFFRSFAPIF